MPEALSPQEVTAELDAMMLGLKWRHQSLTGGKSLYVVSPPSTMSSSKSKSDLDEIFRLEFEENELEPAQGFMMGKNYAIQARPVNELVAKRRAKKITDDGSVTMQGLEIDDIDIDNQLTERLAEEVQAMMVEPPGFHQEIDGALRVKRTLAKLNGITGIKWEHREGYYTFEVPPETEVEQIQTALNEELSVHKNARGITRPIRAIKLDGKTAAVSEEEIDPLMLSLAFMDHRQYHAKRHSKSHNLGAPREAGEQETFVWPGPSL